MDELLARMRAHRNNILRYRKLLVTKLMEHERQYILRRLSEERSALKALNASDLLALKSQVPTDQRQPSRLGGFRA
jgi:hypothetical protein